MEHIFYAIKLHGKYLHRRTDRHGGVHTLWQDSIDGVRVVRFSDRGAADAMAANLNVATSGASAEVVRMEMDAD